MKYRNRSLPGITTAAFRRIIMRIVLLGSSSESKKMFVLAMARILSVEHTVKIFSTGRYDYEDEKRDVCDFCGIEVHNISAGKELLEIPESAQCDYALIDTHIALDAGNDVRLVSFIRPERSSFEETVEQTGLLLKRYPYTDIHLVFYDVLEYCKITPEFLEKLYFRRITDSVNVTKSYAVYFEEENAAAVQECLYEERISLKKFTPLWKSRLLNIMADITGIGIKQLRGYLKKAERMK